MPAGVGYSFDPSAGGQGHPGQGEDPSGFSRMSPQQAVKLLSLRIPERAPGQGGIAPQALLTSPGSAAASAAPMGGSQGAGSMSQVIASLMKMYAPGYQSGEPSMGGQAQPAMPPPAWGGALEGFGGGNRQATPRVTPGLEEGAQRQQAPPLQAPTPPPAQMAPGASLPDWGSMMGQFKL